MGTNTVITPSKDRYTPLQKIDLQKIDSMPVMINTQPIIFMTMM